MPVTDIATVGIDTAISGGTIVVGSGTANVKGSWVQLTASTPFTVAKIIIQIQYGTVNNLTENYLIDIGTGGAGAETVVIANIPILTFSLIMGYTAIEVPLAIPTGTRIAVRLQNDSTSVLQILAISAILIEADEAGASNSQTYGADTTTSRGTVVDPGASANTKGAYTQLSASTSADINFLIVCVCADDTAKVSSNTIIDVATGAAASEVVIVPDIQVGVSSATDLITPTCLAIPIPTIPAGTRLAVRAASNNNGSPSRLIDIVLIGLNVPAVSGSSQHASAF